MAFPLLRWLWRLPGDLHVTDPKRLLPAILLCAFANALWPSEAATHDAGIGYRAIGGADLLQEQLRRVSGSIALRFGGH